MNLQNTHTKLRDFSHPCGREEKLKGRASKACPGERGGLTDVREGEGKPLGKVSHSLRHQLCAVTRNAASG